LSQLILPYLRRNQKGGSYNYLQQEVSLRASRYQKSSRASFIVSRHPFARLVSGYRDKLESKKLSYEGFAKPIIKFARGRWSGEEKVPSFVEFVRYLINTDVNNYNIHWKPLYLMCRVCKFTYTHIIHFEELQEEWPQFVADVKLEDDLVLPWRNRVKGEESHSSYFKAISQEEKRRLYNKFQPDFLMFGYHVDDEI